MKNNKSLGQHWLKNRTILNEIADLARADMTDETICLEIGPGLGTLTASLLKRFAKVIAIEYDPRLAANLPKSFPNTSLEVVPGDILVTDIAALASGQPYVVAGNIPYYITSPILRHLLAASPAAERIVLLIQKEVAERVAAAAGHHSLLSVMVQNRARVELGPLVPAAEFTPPPKVDSQVIILEPLSEPAVSDAALRLARHGFASPRKKLVHNLAGYKFSKPVWVDALAQIGLNENVRAEDLELIDWEELAKIEKVLAKS